MNWMEALRVAALSIALASGALTLFMMTFAPFKSRIEVKLFSVFGLLFIVSTVGVVVLWLVF